MALERLDEQIEIISKTLRNNPSHNELLKKVEFFSQRKEDLLKMQLVVSFFKDKALEYQAMIFSTINRTQKKVSDSLVSSLFGLTSNDSPQKTSLQIVLALNAHHKSPFFNRINLYGNDYDKNQSPPLTQAGMVSSILRLISENFRESERDRFKKRKELLNRSMGSKKELPFRKYYSLNQDKKISDILFYYFNAVKETFIGTNSRVLWDFFPDTMKPQNILQTTVGYNALLSLLVDILKIIPEENKFNLETYKKILNSAKDKINVLDISRYPFTSKTQNIFYLDLSLAIYPPIDSNDSRLIKLNKILESNN